MTLSLSEVWAVFGSFKEKTNIKVVYNFVSTNVARLD